MFWLALTYLVIFGVLMRPGTNLYRHKHKLEDMAFDQPWPWLALIMSGCGLSLAAVAVLG